MIAEFLLTGVDGAAPFLIPSDTPGETLALIFGVDIPEPFNAVCPLGRPPLRSDAGIGE